MTQSEEEMNKFMLMLPLAAFGLAGCETAGQNAALGGLTGAAVGAAVSDDKATGALIGGAVGVAASTVIEPTGTAGQCYYRDARGQRYIDRC
ncbi:MAG: hypothetical protein ACRC14_14275 [Paracoccaceae bacterium]